MLNRRYLRVKVFQSLYSYFQTGNKEDYKAIEKELFNSTRKVLDLYLFIALLLLEVRDFAEEHIEQGKVKRLPTEKDLNPNKKFIENQILKALSENQEINKLVDLHKISWRRDDNDYEVVKKVFRLFKESEEYQKYMALENATLKEDRAIIDTLLKRYIWPYEMLHFRLEEKSIYWIDDLDLVVQSLSKTLDSIKQSTTPTSHIMPTLFKDEDEDVPFMRELLLKTIENSAEFEEWIGQQTKNWELDRIALLDVLLMKMAITELLYFKSIPVKVTLNEYIELSKMYSTPKSSTFINGILDKLVEKFKKENRIIKTGRGLME